MYVKYCWNIHFHFNRIFDDVNKYFAMWHILSMDETWKWIKNGKGGNFFKHWNGCKGSMGESCIVVINFLMHIHQSI